MEEGPFLPHSWAACHSLLLLTALPTCHLWEPGLVSAPGPPGPRGLDHYLTRSKQLCAEPGSQQENTGRDPS